MVTAEALAKLVVPPGPIVPSGKAKPTVPRSVAPSWRCSVAVSVPPQVPAAVSANGRAMAGPPGVRTPYACGPPGAVTPPVGRRVATRLVDGAVPLLLSARLTVTVSSGSMAPLPRPQSSAVSVPPAGAVTGTATTSASRVVTDTSSRIQAEYARSPLIP